MKKHLLTSILFTALTTAPALAADYKIDPSHSFITFKINHIGMSLLHGRFNTLSGKLRYDNASPEDSSIEVQIDPASIDTNHAERDKHLRNPEFLDVEKYPEASFRSTSFAANDQGGTLKGILDLHGVSKEITVDVIKIGEGDDPWGNYRVGFSGNTQLTLTDFGINYNLGPAAKTLQMDLSIEGILLN